MSVTIKSSKLSARVLYEQGLAKLQAERASKEQQKLGNLRAGNSGVVTKDNGTIAACERVAYLRTRGVDTEPGLDKQLMFAGGFGNEDDWVEKLTETWTKSGGGLIKCEEDIPIQWETSNGSLVTGRPDLVLCRPDGTPKLGLELKQTASMWSSRNTNFKLEPTGSHLAQACHYMWQLNIPFKLVYTSRVNWTVPWKFKKDFAGKPAAEPQEDPFRVIPYIREYDLDIKDGVLYYETEGIERTRTVITVDGIREFYERAASIGTEKTLPPRPSDANATGGKAYAPCKYCAFAKVCDKYEDKSFDDWFDHAVLISHGQEIE